MASPLICPTLIKCSYSPPPQLGKRYFAISLLPVPCSLVTLAKHDIWYFCDECREHMAFLGVSYLVGDFLNEQFLCRVTIVFKLLFKHQWLELQNFLCHLFDFVDRFACVWEKIMPGSAWLLLNRTWIPFPGSQYNFFHFRFLVVL